MTLSGNDARGEIINELLDSGREEEARRMLRKALAEMTRDLETVLARREDAGGIGGTCPEFETSALIAKH